MRVLTINFIDMLYPSLTLISISKILTCLYFIKAVQHIFGYKHEVWSNTFNSIILFSSCLMYEIIIYPFSYIIFLCYVFFSFFGNHKEGEL